MQRNIETYDIVLCNLLSIVNSKYIPFILSLGQATPKPQLTDKELFSKVNAFKKIRRPTFNNRKKRLKSLNILTQNKNFIELLDKGKILFELLQDLDGEVSPLKKDALSLKILELLPEDQEIDPDNFQVFPKSLIKSKLKKFLKYNWLEIADLHPHITYKFTDVGKNLKKKITNFIELNKKQVQIPKSQIITLDWEMFICLKEKPIRVLFILGTAAKSSYGYESDKLLYQELNLPKSAFSDIKKELIRQKWIVEEEEVEKVESIVPTDKGKLYLEKFMVN